MEYSARYYLFVGSCGSAPCDESESSLICTPQYVVYITCKKHYSSVQPSHYQLIRTLERYCQHVVDSSWCFPTVISITISDRLFFPFATFYIIYSSCIQTLSFKTQSPRVLIPNYCTILTWIMSKSLSDPSLRSTAKFPRIRFWSTFANWSVPREHH